MNNVIEFNYKNSVEYIEKTAFDRLRAMKIKKDKYLVPSITFVSGSLETEVLKKRLGKINRFFNNEVVENINSIDAKSGDLVTIFILKKLEDGRSIVQVTNVKNEKTILTQAFTDFDEYNKKKFTGLIAGALYERNISVTFYDTYSLEQIKEKINN